MGGDTSRAAQKAEAWNLTQHVVDCACREVRTVSLSSTVTLTGVSLASRSVRIAVMNHTGEDGREFELDLLSSRPAGERPLDRFETLAQNLKLELTRQICR